MMFCRLQISLQSHAHCGLHARIMLVWGGRQLIAACPIVMGCPQECMWHSRPWKIRDEPSAIQPLNS